MAVINIKGYEVLIDDEDVDRVMSKSWHINNYHGSPYFRHGYATKKDGKKAVKTILLHRFILKLTSPRPLIDHANGNTLDNRKANLRLCNHLENSRNSKTKKSLRDGHLKGAYPRTRGGKWYSVIRVDGKLIPLGTFVTKEEAHLAYCEGAVKYFGEFARFE